MSLPPIGIDYPTPMLTHVRDLEAFEGPILAEYRSDTSRTYLQKWCTRGGGVTRWLYVRSDQRSIAAYLAGRTTMLDLLTRASDDIGILIDRGRDTVRSYLVQVSSLPDKYLPDPNVRHNPNLRPDWDEVPESFFVGNGWNASMFGEIERRYLELFAFTFFAANDDSSEPGSTSQYFPDNVLRYRVKGGWIYHRIFTEIRNYVPPAKRARSTGVAAASPGVLTIAAPRGTAILLRKAMDSTESPDTVLAYRVMHDWCKVEDPLVSEIPSTAIHDVRDLATRLNVNTAKLLREEHLTDPKFVLACARILAGYFRRLRTLKAAFEYSDSESEMYEADAVRSRE